VSSEQQEIDHRWRKWTFEQDAPVVTRVTAQTEGDSVRGSQTAARAGAVVLLAMCGTSLLALPASAADVTPPAVATNWYWAEAAPAVDGQAVPVSPPAPTSGVADGDLGVGILHGTDKVAAVGFDLTQIPAGSTFSSFVVTVPLDSAATQAMQGTPDLSACENIDKFTDGTGPSAFASAPPISGPSCVKGTYKATIGKAGGWEFNLTAVANDWSGGAPVNGITIQPTSDAANPAPFTVSLLGKNGITTAAQYTSPSTVVAPPVTAVVPPVAPAPPLVGGYAPLPPVTPQSAPAPVLDVLPPIVPVPAPAPQIVAPVDAAPVTSALSGYVPGSLRPTGAFWAGLAAVAALLGLTSLSLGDPMAPVTVDARRRRFSTRSLVA
jgi:hypothetical protein